MSYTATVLKVMIASPSDVAQERLIAQSVIHEWNAIHSEDRGLVLLPVAWETHASPALGIRAQEIINRQLLRDTDLMVAIFWTRLGTPTGVAASGTVEEIEEHVQAQKPVMLYFSTAPVRPDSVDEAQYRALKAFRDSKRQQGLVEEYDSPDQFREKFRRQLTQTIMINFRSDIPPDVVSGAMTGPMGSYNRHALWDPGEEEHGLIASLSEDARELLQAAGRDRHGTVLKVETFGGLSVQADEREFVQPGDARSEARWRSALGELVSKGLLEQRDRDGAVFSITSQGFTIVDLMQRT